FARGIWAKASFGIAPPARSAAMMSADSSGFPPVIFGGSNGPFSLNDTWVLEAPPILALSATPMMEETSSPVTVTASGSGGTPPYHALIAFGDGANALVEGDTLSFLAAHAYLKAGFYSPSVNLTDAAGVLVATRIVPAVQIVAGPALGPASEPGVGDAGLALSFLGGRVTNGTGPFRFVWSFGDGGTASGQNATHAYATAGMFGGNLTVTDALGGSSVVTFTEVIHGLPTVTLAAAPHAPMAGTATAFYGNVSGGTAPYRYHWTFGDGGTGAVPSPRHNYSASGSFTVQLWVNDSLGASAHQTLAVSVGPAQTPPPPPVQSSGGGSSNAPIWFWPGVGALIVVGVIGSILLLRRGRSTNGP
ncbi:MAG: PKD domain-containing protein, partial [Thermoplasmata archaeon]|nr:PKD domain-containing protein [Thermoplasmata archaeon]